MSTGDPQLPLAQGCIASLKTLPPLPTVAAKIIDTLGDEFVDGNTIADIVAEDPGISARLISLANSAYFALQSPVFEMRQVVNRVLGADTVRSMTLALASRSILATDTLEGFDGQEFWYRALRCAAAMKIFASRAEQLTPEQQQSAYVTGLCHDLGTLALWVLDPNTMRANAHAPAHLVDDALVQQLGYSARTVTAALAEQWGMPAPMREAFSGRARLLAPPGRLALVLESAALAVSLEGCLDEEEVERIHSRIDGLGLHLPLEVLTSVIDVGERERTMMEGAAAALASS